MPSRLRVLLLPDAKVTERGILYRRGGRAFLLAWPRVSRAFAAVLEDSQLEFDAEFADRSASRPPTTLFDLVVESEGAECTVCRVRCRGESASRIARALRLTLGAGSCNAELRALADELEPQRRFPDEETFRDAVLESVRWDRACADAEPAAGATGWLRGAP